MIYWGLIWAVLLMRLVVCRLGVSATHVATAGPYGPGVILLGSFCSSFLFLSSLAKGTEKNGFETERNLPTLKLRS